MYELIITEKPAAAKKIAEALADGKLIKESLNGVPYYKISQGKKDIIIACAVGHLYALAEREKKGWRFPVFDIEWKPIYEAEKKSAFSKKYLSAIKKLAKGANEFTVACDYDQEGSVIGKNIIAFACNQKDAYRMKFSTLTKEDLREAYKNKSRHLDWGQIEAGETRHNLDWINGVNYSRALTSAIKMVGSFKLMSTGRVQGPALKIIVDREREIKAFKPTPYWQIELNGSFRDESVIAWHKQDKFWEKEKADNVMRNVENQKTALVDKVEKRQFNQAPPYPFDLTSLQIEAYRCLGVAPKQTLSTAQELYIAGFISYPRTSSQKLPITINYKKILQELSKQNAYSKLASEILKLELKPNEGKKSDPAHPAIYPTGIKPVGIKQNVQKIYDLIVRRFIAAFAKPALRETMTVDINVNKEIFIAKGTRTIDKGWHIFYEPYVKLEEVELPKMEKGDKIEVKKIILHDKETQPPKRYTEASIIKELERRNLGTKSTRSEIIETLFGRGYVYGKQIGATELGIKTVETLEKYVPKIIDEELTRHFEEETEKIMEGKQKKEMVLEEAKGAITRIISDFKKSEKEIGNELAVANRETRDEMENLGRCPICQHGDITLRKGKFGSFAACNKYPECKTTFSMPSNALIKPAKKNCEVCSYPMVIAIKKGKKPREFCINKECKSKYSKGAKEAGEIKQGIIEKNCPKCKGGILIVRSSIYGKFLGCKNFPKCKYVEGLTDEAPLREDFVGKFSKTFK